MNTADVEIVKLFLVFVWKKSQKVTLGQNVLADLIAFGMQTGTSSSSSGTARSISWPVLSFIVKTAAKINATIRQNDIIYYWKWFKSRKGFPIESVSSLKWSFLKSTTPLKASSSFPIHGRTLSLTWTTRSSSCSSIKGKEEQGTWRWRRRW